MLRRTTVSFIFVVCVVFSSNGGNRFENKIGGRIKNIDLGKPGFGRREKKLHL